MTEANNRLASGLVLAANLLIATTAFAQTPLATHRAFYELVLDPTRQSSKVDMARGRIAYEITGGDCVGYSVTLRQVTALDSGEGKQILSDLRSITWESADASNYRFKTQNYIDQQLKDDVDGTADRAGSGFAVKLAKPKRDRLTLRGSILLPTEHIRKLLEAAAAGQRTLETKVFDGTPDGRKVYDTLSVIGAPVEGDKEVEPPARRPELAALKRYPVTISYFEPGEGERTPAYVLGFELYENGVSRALRLDYGAFALRGELTNLEFVPPAPCRR